MMYFDISEFDCQHTGENFMEQEFLDKLDVLRDECNFPFLITSGYRSPTHPIEAVKEIPGTHSQGIAADIAVNSATQRFTLVQKAIEHGFTGIGVAKTFVHVDTRGSAPVIWTY